MHKTINVAEQLSEVECLIEVFRWARYKPEEIEERTYRALTQIAKDLRGRLPGAPSEALRALDRRIEGALRLEDPASRVGALRGIGEELVGRWPAVRAALEREASSQAKEAIE